MPRSPRIVVIEPSGVRRDVPLNASPFRIGRQAGNELTLRDSRISRQQAQIISLGEGATIEELVERVEAPAPSAPGSRELHHLGVLLDVARTLGSGLSLEDVLT